MKKNLLGNKTQKQKLKQNIINHIHTLIYGKHGIGKSYATRRIILQLGLEEMISYPLSQEDIVRDFGVAPQTPNKVCFIIEADSLSKKTYRIINSYLNSSKNPLVFIALSKNSLHANLLKKLDCIEFKPPTHEEVAYFLKQAFNWEGNISTIYDEDIRVVMRRLLYDRNYKFSLEELDEVQAEKVAFDILRGYAGFDSFEKYHKPFNWVLNWLAHNLKKFFPRDKKKLFENLSIISWIGSQLFIGQEPSIYLKGLLLQMEHSRRMGKLQFPPQAYKEKKKKEVNKIKKKRIKTPMKKTLFTQTTLIDELFEP